MQLYAQGGREGLSAFKIKPLVVYGAMAAVEGDAADGVVILEFPSVEEAKAWYFSPANQERVPHRLRAAAYRTMIFEGCAPQPS